METRAALTAEIQENLSYVALRGQAMPCVDRRLSELRALIDQWGRTAVFKTPLWVAQAPRMGLSTIRFDAAQSAGRLALLPSEEQFRIGSVVNGLAEFQKVQEQEIQAWSKLRALQAGAAALSPSDRSMIRMGFRMKRRLVISTSWQCGNSSQRRPVMVSSLTRVVRRAQNVKAGRTGSIPRRFVSAWTPRRKEPIETQIKLSLCPSSGGHEQLAAGTR